MVRLPLEKNERTRDIYEAIEGYPKPPLIPIPDSNEIDLLEELGIKNSSASRMIAKAVIQLTGFEAFKKQLPNTIEGLLRNTQQRGHALFAPVVSATMAIEDDYRNLSPIERAATLIFAARRLYEEIKSGKLPPDEHRGQVLEMGQYPNLFSTGLIVDGKKIRLFKSTNASQITVIVDGKFYVLEIGDIGPKTTIEPLMESLAELLEKAQRKKIEKNEISPGILTCAKASTQRKAFKKLQKIDCNAASFSVLRHSFLTLCLDLDYYPSSHAEAALIAHSGNPKNRWYHSSSQLVVFGNSKACAIACFDAYLDGNTMVRGFAEIQKRAVVCSLAKDKKKKLYSLPPAAKLNWKIDGNLIRQAEKDFKSVKDNQQATFEIHGIGSQSFAEYQVKPIPAFTLALQMATKRLTGKMSRVFQFITMSRYRCMDIEIASVTTPESIRFVNYMESVDVQRGKAKALLHKAIESQELECRKTRQQLSSKAIFSLFMLSQKGIRRIYVTFIIGLAALLLRMLNLWGHKQDDIAISHPVIYPEIPIIGRPGIRLPYLKDFGLHYQILEDRIVITMMPAVDWTIANTELIAELEKSLKRIQTIVGNEV